MKKVFLSKFFLTLAFFVLVATSAYIFSVSPIKQAQSQTSSQELGGYGWSSTIGWIDFNGVTVDSSSGNMSGFGWSSNIGWIKSDVTSGFPSGSGTTASRARLSGDDLIGWMRFCSGTINKDCNSSTRTDGWDGWVSLNGSNYGVSVSNTPGPVANSHYLEGYAWGSDVVGWIDMDGVYITDDNSVGSSDLTLSLSGGCKVDASWTAATNATNYVLRRNGTQIYSGPGLFRQDTPGAPATYTYTITAYNGSVAGPVDTQSIAVGACTVTVQPPTIGSFKPIPTAVESGDNCSLEWKDIENVDVSLPGDSCTITGPGMTPYVLPATTDGSYNAPNITQTTRYTLRCVNSAGEATKQATCAIKPKYVEF